MMERFIDRENRIFDSLRAFNEHDLEFIVVGDYAVSAFQHRFSVDADLVVTSDTLDAFVEILENNGFEKAEDKELDAYGGRFVAYEKDADLPVSIDLLVDGLQSRQTDATWSYDYIDQHAVHAEIEGTERMVAARIPEKELLIAVKLHRGRLTDARDVVALADDVDFEVVAHHLDQGDPYELRTVLETVLDTIESDDFADAFRGVFTAQEVSQDRIDAVRTFLRERIADLST